MKTIINSTALALALGGLASAACAADLRVDVGEVRSDAGKIMVALHTPSAEFPNEGGVVAAQWRQATPGQVAFVFADLAAGEYAVAVYHDENGNGELDRNFIGIPAEGYGFSRDAKGFAGPPSFDAAAVKLESAATLSISAKLSY